MGIRTTLTLLVIAGLLLTTLLLTKEQAGEDPLGVPVLDGSMRDATRIRFDRGPDTWPIDLRRQDNGPFRIVEPIEDLASRARIVALASAFDSALMAEAFPDMEVDDQLIERLGLSRPRAIFEVWFRDGRHVVLEIGGEGPLGNDVYLRREGKVYRGGMALYSSLQVGLDDLREPLVFLNSPATAASVKLDQRLDTGARERLELVLDGTEWRLRSPIASRTQWGLAEAFLAQLLSLRIDQFSDSVMRMPEGDPDFVIEVDGALGSETVRLWRDANNHLIGDLAARKIGFVSHNQQFTAIFENAAANLRARWIIPIEDLTKELLRVVVDWNSADRPRLVVVRDHSEAEFRLLEPVDARIAVTPRAEMIQAINNLQVIQFVDGSPADERFGLSGSQLTVSVLGSKQRQPTELRIGADDRLGEVAVTYLLRRDEPDRVVAVPKAAIDLLRREWTVYVDRGALRLEQPVQRLEVLRGAETRSYRMRDERWRLEGSDLPLDWVGALVDEVRDLRAQRVHGARQMELGDADWQLHLCRPEGDVLAELQVWDRGAGQPLLVATPTRPGLIYELNQFLSDFLRRLL